MTCAWDELIKILPYSIRNEVDKIGKYSLQELRFRVGNPIKLVCNEKSYYIDKRVCSDDIQFVINAASKYSPWKAQSSANGYITASGGHRIGICGEVVMCNGMISGVCNPTSLCVRVARDFPGISDTLTMDNSSLLIIGPPGSGKTTLLRDIIRNFAAKSQGSISVVDERGEIFPIVNGEFCFLFGRDIDIMTNCAKSHSIDMLVRCMGPSCIAIDEITREEDSIAIKKALGCGVSFIATAHAAYISDLKKRNVYKSLLEDRVFERVITLDRNKTWVEERI